MLELTLFNTHDVFLLITCYQCIFFAALAFILKIHNRQSSIFLAGFLLSCAVIPLDILINFGAGMREWMIDNHPNWFYVFEFGFWTQGPLLLWYVRSLLLRNFSLTWYDLLHFLPFVLYCSYQIMGYHQLPADVKSSIQRAYDIINEPSMVFYILVLRDLLRLFFAVSCLLTLNRYRAQLEQRFSDGVDLYFPWLNPIIYGAVGLFTWYFIISLLVLFNVAGGGQVNIEPIGLAANYSTCFYLTVFIIVIAAKSSLSSNETNRYGVVESSKKESTVPSQVKLIESYMAKEKPYLNLTLTLESLANQLGMSPRALSTTINRYCGNNFFEFINTYRIKTAKTLLASEEHRQSTILDIMHLSGFNSKATFNSFFKKTEGMTPREYRTRHLPSLSKASDKNEEYENDQALEATT